MFKLVIPKSIDEKYNHAIQELPPGEGTLVGNQDKLEMLEVALHDPETPSAMILGEQGIGKTALVEQLLFERQKAHKKLLVPSLSIEALGELPENTMIARMRTLLTDMNEVEAATRKAAGEDIQIALFIDEIHKLNRYGYNNGSSGAMNALKEGTARGKFPIITATTDYEYRKNIATDLAFDRRFAKIIMEEPDQKTVIKILQRRLVHWKEQGKYVPKLQENILTELVMLADAYIRNQVNPAKSLGILSRAVGYCSAHYEKTGEEILLDHKVLQFVFFAEGYNVDSTTTAEHVKQVVHKRVKGQPLAIKYLTDVINSTFYTKRDRKRPLMTIFAVGTTGVGKTESAKALADAFFGRSDAILTLNGGDYSTPEDALTAQHFIGDSMAVNKQQVILLDEIEKSHKNVLYAYMRMIDEGIVRDSLNIERSVNNTIIVATSNLGAQIFSDLAQTMNLNKIRDPDRLSPQLVDEWYRQESSVRKALQSGDKNMNNGIKPEFLERFQLFIPYLPLPRKIMAQIARSKLEGFKRDMYSLGYSVRLPKPKDHATWQTLLGEDTTYDNIDTVSVMIAEDIVNTEASTSGARTINRFLETSIKPKVANIISSRIEEGKPVDAHHVHFDITTNGNALFESTDRERPDVAIKVTE